jgi:hypothetical protein
MHNHVLFIDKTKARREIPVNDEFAAILKEIRKEEGLTSEWVFTYARRTIDRLDRGFSGTPYTKVTPLVTY